jgi:Zn-dependent metalloprotease
MKKSLLFILLILPCILTAQEAKKKIPPSLANRVQKVEYNDRTNFPSMIIFKEQSAPDAVALGSTTNWAKEIFPLRASDDFLLKDTYADEKRNEHFYKYQQKYLNVPVEYAFVRVREQNGKIKSVVGDFYAELQVVNKTSISEAQALEFAKQAIPAKKYKWEMKEEEAALKQLLEQADFSYDPKTTLVIFPIENTFRYAFKLDIYTHEPDARYTIYIDAEDGRVLMKTPTMCSIDVRGNAQTKYHGVQSIQTDSLAPNTFVLRENNRKNRGMKIETRNSLTNFEQGSVDFTDTDNFWNNVNPQMDEAAADCHFGVEMTYDYFLDSLGRDSYNGDGSKLLQYVHFEKNWFNAQWTGSYSRFGDGNGEPLTSIDIVSHEITHGVTQFTAGLEYQLESGALNESFSDIFGTVVEFKKLNSGASWLIGQRSFTLRDMSNPNARGNPDCYGGRFWTNQTNCAPTNANDWCGVHNNSGVQNFWFYLLCVGDTGVNDLNNAYTVEAIGMDKAAQIAYRNLRDYLNPNSTFADARAGSIQAAIDLYGYDSKEMIAVMNAWHAVGVGKAYTFLPVAAFKLASPVCAPNSTASFVNEAGSAQSYLWKFGDGGTSTDINPTHTYANVGSYDVELIATNPNGSDTIRKQQFINIFTDAPITSTCAVNMLNPVGTTGIYKVEFANIENASEGPQVEDPYMDYNCSRAIVARNTYYPIKITTHFTSPVFTRVYVDWNNNGAFDLPQELAFKTDNTTEIHAGTVLVPKDAVVDQPLRMRIVSAKATNNFPDDPCAGVRNGQIEDYSVVVSSALGFNKLNSFYYKVYPNPSNSELFVETSDEQHHVGLYDVLGREVLSLRFSKDVKIDLSGIASGIYTLKLVKGEVLEVQKIVVRR